MKISFKRVLSFVIALVMILGMLPTMATHNHAHAAGTLTVSDANIGLSWSDASNSRGTAAWTASGTTVTGSAKGYRGGFMNLSSFAVTTTLTITNNHSDDRTLSFDYNLNGGSVSGIISGTSGSYSDTLAAGASATITLTSPKGTSSNTLTISGLALLSASNVTSTFLAPENGSYTVDGAAVTAQTQLTKPATEAYALTATPAANYMFFGWWSEASQSYVSYDNPASLKFPSDPRLKPVFLHNTTALFGVGTKTFADLTEAANFAASSAATTKTVILLNNGTVSGSHTIPVGVTLLIPYNDSNTQYGSEASCTSYSSYINADGNIKWVQPTAYRTLTLAANAKITVNGSIEVSGQHAASNGSERYCGAPTGPLGWVKMLSGSNITLNSGSNLYSWGYIQGAGTITAKSGSKVYENFQFTDFRGGTNTSGLASEGLVFPINQYYVQNIEVATTYEYGAEEHIATSIFMSNQKFSATVKFMGNGGMFVPASGSTIVKDYIENRDRMQIDVNGDGTLNSMSLSLGGTKINSATFVLPLTSNITINIHSGTTTANQSVSLLPGAEMTIDQGATLVIAKGNGGINDYTTESFGLIVYDYDEWTYGINLADGSTVAGKYAFGKGSANYSGQMSPLVYAPGRTYNRTVANDLKDAKLNVNGTIICNGYLYTTAGGGNIMSSGKTGKIVLQSGAGNDMMDFQANDATALVIPMQSAQLKNGDDSYVSTYIYHYDDEGTLVVDYQATAGTEYKYCATHDCWYTGECEKCNAQVNIKWMNGSTEIYNTDIASGSVPSFDGTAPTKTSDASNHYTFAGWSTNPNATTPDILGAVTADTIYYAVFTPAAHNDDKIEGGKHYCTVCNYQIGSCNDTNKDHKCDVGGEDMVCSSGYLTQQAGQSATCGVDGWKAYYQCSCGKYYADEQAKTLIGDSNALAAWKTGAGKISATGNHTPKSDDGDCTTAIECSVCGTVTTPAKTHVDGDDKNHVCDNAGCTVDNVSNHTNGTPVQEKVNPATCTTAGSYDEVVYCTECGEEVSRTNKEIPALQHDWNEPTYTWSADGKTCTAERTCKRDGSHKETETVNATGVVTTDPTCTAMGVTTYTANFTAAWAVDGQTTTRTDVAKKEHAFNSKASNQQATAADCENAATYYVQCDHCDAVDKTKTVAVGSANNHDWNEPTYTWSADGKTCTAERTCKRDGSHKETETVNATGVVTTEGKCNVPEVVTYTATFDVDWAETQTNPVTGEKNPDVHAFDGETGYYKDNGDGTHSFICGPCGQPVEGKTEAHDKAGQVYQSGNCRVPETVGCSKCPAVIEYSTNPDVHAAVSSICVDNEDGATHTVKWPCCDKVVNTAEPHDYESGTTEHTCACGAVETFELKLRLYEDEDEFHFQGTFKYGEKIVIPNYQDPERKGYQFLGWGFSGIPETMPAQDLDLIARWSDPISYSVKWFVNGEMVHEHGYNYDDTVSVFQYTIPEGHTFSGWTDQNGKAITGDFRMPDYDLEIRATLTVNTYTITWKIGDQTWTTNPTHGQAITEPDVSVPGNYYGYGWTTEIPETASGNLTIEGYWTAKLVVLDENGNEMQFASDGLSYYPQWKIAKVGETAYANYRGTSYKEGHTLYLVNVYDATEKYEITYESGATVYPSVPMTENKTLQLTAVPKTYTIRWDTNGDGTVDDTTSVKYGEVPTHADGSKDATAQYTYTFTGWKDAEGNAPVAVTGEATYTAQFTKTANTYKITYKVNDKLVHEEFYAYGAAVTAWAYTPEEGYIFSGWDAVPGHMPAHDVEVNGTTTIKTYTITWKNPDGTDLAFTTVEFGKVPAFPEGQTPLYPDTMAEEGYDYAHIGWSEKLGGEKLDSIPAATGDAIYYAVYSKTAKNYLVTWTVDGEWYKETTFAYGAAITAPQAPTKEGYTFSGWDIPETMPAENIILDATLKVNNYTVTWKINGEVYTTTDVAYGAAITAPAYNVPEGHTFSGWTVDATMPAKNMTYNATLTVNTYTVTWLVDGKEFATTQATYGQVIPTPATNPTKEGYTFQAWNTYPATMPANENLRIEAVFTVNKYQVTWFANGGNFKLGGITPDRVGTNVAYGAKIAFTNYNLPTREGYTFTGWNTKADGTGESLSAETVMNTTDNLTVYYAQWEVNTYTLTLSYINLKGEYEKKTIQVPFGTKLSELAEVLALPETFTVDNTAGANLEEIIAYVGTYKLSSWTAGKPGSLTQLPDDQLQSLTMPAMDYCLDAGYWLTGWQNYYGCGWEYWIEHTAQPEGWIQVDGAWYYLKPATDLWGNEIFIRAEGLTRVPYNTELGHGPNAADKAYWEAHKDTSKYSDAETAMYVFDENGKLVRTTGIVNDNGTTRYAVDGVIAWHVGFVKVDNDYYYFAGDKLGGGNIMKTGKVYATRDYNAKLKVGSNDIYYFGTDGKLIKNEGIVNIDGTLYYFDTYRVAVGAGLVKIGDNYIFVRTSGKLAIGEYWMSASKTNGYPVKGGKCYTFDENGYLTNAIDPNKNGIVDGYYYKDGEPYYAGLININGDIYYVNSRGQIVTGTYYVTKTNDMEGFAKGDKLTFGKDGKLQAAKNGVVEENGVLYYYVDNRIDYGAGVVQMVDENGKTYYIYVTSNGQLATGIYWPTTRNGYLESGAYDWGTDGRYYPEN